MSEIAVMTDHGSTEGSSAELVRAVQLVTATTPTVLDARDFYDGGEGHVRTHGSRVSLEVPSAGVSIQPSVLIVYEIPPADRHRLTRFQVVMAGHGRLRSLGLDAQPWRTATDKHLMVARFLDHGVRQMESRFLDRPTYTQALAAFEHLGGDVWARPAIGFGGRDVHHIDSLDRLRTAVDFYAGTDCGWLLTRDARNFDPHGRRHQYRVVVLGDQVLRVCEHIQDNPDVPCNEAQGAVSTVLPVDALPRELLDLAITATAAVGLPFGGVDLVPHHGGVVFEVNVHPVLDVPGGFDKVTVPYVVAHLDALDADHDPTTDQAVASATD
ncbi:hypothetical protein OG563_28775 [Nocardia vinacea]|uniref:ATP-grasp fold RimK-type domain-containing protein n=1 Tax=Nocardia vinacea TaxID=96468 RepID=A0ABZ1YJ42_9NOCA|nr:hypothetical protein [Nocardia vinacea]